MGEGIPATVGARAAGPLGDSCNNQAGSSQTLLPSHLLMAKLAFTFWKKPENIHPQKQNKLAGG